MTKGYWKKPKQNKQSFFKAGGRVWFRTGDIVKMDDEGYFWFVERTKDFIKYKGLSVYPKEIKDVLYDHPKVKEAAVIGVPMNNFVLWRMRDEGSYRTKL